MRTLFHLGHPAHFHLFKNVIKKLHENNHETSILIKKKDVLESLLKESGLEYHNILPSGRKDSKFAIALGLLKQDLRLFFFCLKKRPKLLMGTSVSIAHVGWLLRIPSLVVNEDDADVVPLFSKLAYPFATKVISPDVCNNSKWEGKSIKYNSYHELAYLHPNNFSPQKEIVAKYFNSDKPYVLMRFASLGAHHDFGIKGIDDELALKMIEIIKPYADVYITSERKYSGELESYRLKINPTDIHHVMANAVMYIGDSQTMAAEAGVLGIPFVRYNDFVGKIGYLKDLEENYQLGYGIIPGKKEELLNTVERLITDENLKTKSNQKLAKMLNDKVDFTEFMYNLMMNYNK